MTLRISAALLVALTLTACGGRDGPQEREHGFILFWQVQAAELVWRDCTDADQFRSAIAAPTFEDNSFVVYRVSDDGNSLIDQDCTAIDASTCVDSELDIVFQRSGDVFLHDPPLVVGTELAPNCRLTSDPLWTLEDQGQQLSLDVSLTFGLDGGSACEGVDQNVARSGTNEFGIDGCVATIEVDADYYTRRRP